MIARAGRLAVRAKRKRRQPRPRSPEQLHARELGRAWHWGRRYSRKRWRRRPPPRYRPTSPHDEARIDLSRTFLRGYDAQTRITYRYRYRVMSASWPEVGQQEPAAEFGANCTELDVPRLPMPNPDSDGMTPLFADLPEQAPPVITTDHHALLTCTLCTGVDGEFCAQCDGAGVLLVKLSSLPVSLPQATNQKGTA